MNDDLNDDLHDLFHDAVSDVDPAHRLPEILERTGSGSARRRWYAAGGAFVLAAAASVAVVAAVSGGPSHEAADPAGTGPTDCSPPLDFHTRTGPVGCAGPSDTPTDCQYRDYECSTATLDPYAPEPSASAVTASGGGVHTLRAENATTAYFVGTTPSGPRLFSEQHYEYATPGDTHGVQAALTALMDGPDDPDYTTQWLRGSIEGGEYRQGRFDVYVNDSAPLTDRLAMQQLVYTLDAAVGERAPVTVHSAGDTHTDDVVPQKELAVLTLSNITSPSEGDVVSGSFVATGMLSSFEAAGPWELRDADGTVVEQGGMQARGWMGHLYPWRVKVDVSSLPPGTYVFAASTDDPSGGTEGPGPTTDTRTITVQ